MAKHEIEITLSLAKQYLNPNYNMQDKQGIAPQVEKEEALFTAVIGELAKQDQDVLKIWRVVKKTRRGSGD